MRALQKGRLKNKSALVLGDTFSEESGYWSAIGLLQVEPKLTGLLAFSQNALGALRALEERKRTASHDLSCNVRRRAVCRVRSLALERRPAGYYGDWPHRV
jgi:DNA-binding LacI/PurR family transcriptional regulator